MNTLDIDTVDIYSVPQQRYPMNIAVAVPMLDIVTNKNIAFHYVPGLSTHDKAFQARFSWQYRNPVYYIPRPISRNGSKRALMMIAGHPTDSVPPELAEKISAYQHSASFTTYDPIFRFQIIARVYW